MKIKNNTNNNSLLFQKKGIPSNNISYINGDKKIFCHEQIKLFFKKYIVKQRKKKENIKNDDYSDSNSNSNYCDDFDIVNELNNIYLKYYKDLNNFIKTNKNSKGLSLQGNKLLENISLEEFNEIFSQYGKGLEKKLKTQDLNYFYPKNNRPKLMGQHMQLTPIPIKKPIYLKNQIEKKNFKNAERTAVIMRRVEYTHGLGAKKINEEKIFFYIFKGAALIIEDWWIKIMNKRNNKIENKNKYNRYINNRYINNFESTKVDNEERYKNKYIFQLRPKSKKKIILVI